ncbi:serine/threonine protein kinase [Microbispora sp. NBC_01189]|uniref:serine/threonine-protein kinase n=1 Tax=Microbispora sp. NBC_01189 TaxID=2903583 RepID=UPI002E1472E1|nr:serine/threonine protein kinase [Microbispora sp. NBC_01189]
MARGGTGPRNGMPPGVRPLTVGDPVIIGGYLLLGRLGAGGMGVVYLAEHPGGGYVALKTPHPVHLSDPTLLARFAEEAGFSRRVEPFCTAAFVEDGFDGERPYIVTEYVPGPALSQVVTAYGPLTPDLAYGVALGAAAALAATHEAGLVHRDLKPGNVLLSPRGPFVIDFGIARDLDVAMSHTQAGQIMGSPGWVAPERLRGRPAIPASDVFSWGCLVAFAATGLHPFGAGDPETLTRRILVEEPRISPVPGPLRDDVAAALRRDPAERPDAARLLASLLAAGGVHTTADPRRAVAAVLEEIWQPIAYPAGTRGSAAVRTHDGGPEGHGERPPPGRAARRRAARSGARSRAQLKAQAGAGAQASHAGFAALATVTIAAVTVVAAGTGAARMDRTADPPARPVVIPGDGATPPPDVLGTSRPPVRPVSARQPRATVTATRTMPPPAPATPDEQRATAVPSPPPDGGSLRPPPEGHCAPGRRGDCDSGQSSPPAQPSSPPPSPEITTEPQLGDGESPQPSPDPQSGSQPQVGQPEAGQPPGVVATPAPSWP